MTKEASGEPKKCHRRGDLRRMRGPPHADHPPGRHPRHLLEKRRVVPAGLTETRRRRVVGAVGLGFDRTRRYAVDGDSVPHGLARQGDRQPDRRAFAHSGEQRVERRAGAPRLAADVDDAAVIALDHVRQHRLAAAQGVPDIPAHRLLHQLFNEIDEPQADQGGGIVDLLTRVLICP